MKSFTLKLFATAILAIVLFSFGSAQEQPRQTMTLQARLNTPTISFRGGIAYLQLTIGTPVISDLHRKPMNLSVVLDRSGSMGDAAKMEYARKALRKLVDQLQSEDILSIVIYDDVIEILRPARRVGQDRYAIKHLIDEIEPRGSTNLGGGMAEGFRQVERNLGKEYVNRVVLLSDGLANQGVTDPAALERIARRYRTKSISLSTMGVGLDYNENLMVGLAENGGGNYYFIESPHSLASIMSHEFNSLATVCAQNVTIELRVGRGVSLRDVIGSEFRKRGDHYAIPLGDLYSDESRELTVELTIPEGTGSLEVADASLNYESDRVSTSDLPKTSATVRYTKDVALIEKDRDVNVQAKADVALSTRTVDNAMKALDEGKNEEAKGLLKQAEVVLHASPAASAAGAGGEQIRQQAARLDSYQKMLNGPAADDRKAKKSIQYENYKTQKNH